jgi:hypothetical protein
MNPEFPYGCASETDEQASDTVDVFVMYPNTEHIKSICGLTNTPPHWTATRLIFLSWERIWYCLHLLGVPFFGPLQFLPRGLWQLQDVRPSKGIKAKQIETIFCDVYLKSATVENAKSGSEQPILSPWICESFQRETSYLLPQLTARFSLNNERAQEKNC